MDNEQRIARLEANDDNIFHQLTEIKEDVKELHRLTVAVETMAEKMNVMNENVGKVQAKIDDIESQPAKKYQHIQQVIVDCVLTGVIGILLGAIATMIMKG